MNIGIKDVLQRVRPFFVAYLLILAACLFIKIFYSREEIYYAVNTRSTAWGDAMAPYITDLGNGWTTVALSAILLLFNYRKAFLTATSYAITSLLAQAVKFIFDTPRPKLYFRNQLSRIHFVKGVYILTVHSFPSGHTVTAFSTGLLITYFCKNRNWGLLLVLVAAMVGFSRMYLSEHFFEDVLAGSALGVFITVFWLAFIENKRFLHTPAWNKGLITVFIRNQERSSSAQ